MENEEQAGAPVEYRAESRGSFPAAILTPEQWAQVKEACVAGMSYQDAAKIFKTSYDAIRQRASREEWLTPLKIEKVLRAQSVTKTEQVSQRVVEVEKRPETALEAVSATLEGYRSRTLLGLAKLAEKGVSRAIDANLEIENWQDAKIAADIALKLHQVGQDAVQVNICNAFADMDEGKLVETEAEEIADEGSRDSYFIDAE